MTLRRSCERAARIIALALSVAVGGAYAVQAQSPQAKTVFRDPRQAPVAPDKKPVFGPKFAAPTAANNATVPATYEATVHQNDSSKIRQVSANAAPKRQLRSATNIPARPSYKVAQTQYAEAQTDPAATQGFFSQNSDEPFVDKCPNPKEMGSILDVPYKLVPSPGEFPESCPLPDEDYQRKPPTPITFTWKASNLCYKPLYFEDVQLERYGHYCNPLLQPFLSRARFWLTVPCLPYLMGVNPPNECVYDLGYYRPGNCAPSMIEPVPISLRGGLLEAGAIVGLAAALP